MPKFKNWSNKGDGEWEFDDKIIINGERVRPVVHVYRWGSSSNEPTDYFAELYFSGDAEEYSQTIDNNGKVSDYAQPESNREKAKEYARKFMDRVQYAGGILQSVHAPVIKDDRIPDGWSYIEGDKEYVLFEHSNQMSNEAIAVDMEDDGTWKVTARQPDFEPNELDSGLSFKEALQQAIDYMEVN